MKQANIGELKDNLSRYISAVESGEEVAVCRRNRVVARIIPEPDVRTNKTKLGCGRGSVQFIDESLDEPFIPDGDWEMHR